MESENDKPVLSPVTTSRNKFGLIEGVEYPLKEGGKRVDWFAMIPKEYIVPNRQNFIKRNQPIPESVEGLENKDLLVLLEAFRFLCDLRGVGNIEFPIVSSVEGRTTTVCRISWLPNFETNYQGVTTSAIGDATMESTNGFGFIGPISENRAFIRCVRNFLKIPVLGKDELDQNAKVKAAPSKENMEAEEDNSLKTKRVKSLQVLMKEKGISFESLAKKAVEENNMENGTITNLNDFSLSTINDFITRLNKLK